MPREFDPEAHEAFVRTLHADRLRATGRYAVFDELMEAVERGDCTFDEAIAQFKHDAADIEERGE